MKGRGYPANANINININTNIITNISSSRRGAIPWPDSKVRTSAKTISNNNPVKGCCPNQFWTLHWEQCFTVKPFHIIFHFRICLKAWNTFYSPWNGNWDMQKFDKGKVKKTSIIPVGKCKAGCEGAISKWDPCCSNCAVTPTHAISLVTLAILHSDCWLGKQQGETCILVRTLRI